MAGARSTRDLINMIKAGKNSDDQDYPFDTVDKLPSVDKDSKMKYSSDIASGSSFRASTGHLRNMSSYDKSSESVELPNIKSAQRASIGNGDLELKLKKLKNLSQNDKEMIEIQRK